MFLDGTHRNWKIVDTAWIYGASGDPYKNPKTDGVIVHSFTLPGWGEGLTHYVIQIETHIDPVLHIRNWMCMWPTAEKE